MQFELGHAIVKLSGNGKPNFMARERDWLADAAYITQWFACPISVFAWLSARFLTYVFGGSIWRHPDGYVHVLLIEPSRDFHDFVPPWLAYLYNFTSILVIASIAMIAFGRIIERDSP